MCKKCEDRLTTVYSALLQHIADIVNRNTASEAESVELVKRVAVSMLTSYLTATAYDTPSPAQMFERMDDVFTPAMQFALQITGAPMQSEAEIKNTLSLLAELFERTPEAKT